MAARAISISVHEKKNMKMLAANMLHCISTLKRLPIIRPPASTGTPRDKPGRRRWKTELPTGSYNSVS
jgi:hypothetical protein